MEDAVALPSMVLTVTSRGSAVSPILVIKMVAIWGVPPGVPSGTVMAAGTCIVGAGSSSVIVTSPLPFTELTAVPGDGLIRSTENVSSPSKTVSSLMTRETVFVATPGKNIRESAEAW